jgi:hypothetical protein
MLISQELVGEGKSITVQNLNSAIADLNRAHTEDAVRERTLFNPDSIWQMLWINAETGELAVKSGETFNTGTQNIETPDETAKYYQLMQQPRETPNSAEEIKTQPEAKKPQDVRLTSFIADPFGKIDKSEFSTCFLLLWGYLAGSLGTNDENRNVIHVLFNKADHRETFIDLFYNITQAERDPRLYFYAWAYSNIAGKEVTFYQFYNLSDLASVTEKKDVNRARAIVNSPVMQGYVGKFIGVSQETLPKKVFISLLILFLIITPLSNIFAWANIIAIAAMMTKIIISGVGSVIGVGCLVGAIALGCKDKACGKSVANENTNHLYTVNAGFEKADAIQSDNDFYW